MLALDSNHRIFGNSVHLPSQGVSRTVLARDLAYAYTTACSLAHPCSGGSDLCSSGSAVGSAHPATCSHLELGPAGALRCHDGLASAVPEATSLHPSRLDDVLELTIGQSTSVHQSLEAFWPTQRHVSLVGALLNCSKQRTCRPHPHTRSTSYLSHLLS